jgi:hypothetical protein
VDRLDAWLNGQRGRSRLALLWLQSYPVTVALGVVAWANWQPNATPLGIVLGGALLACPCAIPLSLVAVAVDRWRTRRSAKPRLPLIAWRSFVFGTLCAANATIAAISVNETRAWHQQHRRLDIVMIAFCICLFVLVIETSSYTRRVAARFRQEFAGQQ